jgi:hypothetical protein
MHPLRHHHFGIQALFFTVSVALCTVTAVIMAFVRIASAATLFGALGALVLALVVVMAISMAVLRDEG